MSASALPVGRWCAAIWSCWARGDRVPADMLMIQSWDLQTDESLLPARPEGRFPQPVPALCQPSTDQVTATALSLFPDQLSFAVSGIGEVLGNRASQPNWCDRQSLSIMETEAPRLQRQTRRLVGIFAIVGGAPSVFLRSCFMACCAADGSMRC